MIAITHCIQQYVAFFGWLFHYMPMGRAFALGMLPTPEQRLALWRRAHELIDDKNIFILFNFKSSLDAGK